MANSPSSFSGIASASKELSSISDSESSSDESAPIPNIEDFLRDISSSIDKLVQISGAIKKASAQSNSMKAEAYEEWENTSSGKINKSKGFEDFIRILLEHRYRSLNENLRNRLHAALSRCNRRIAYWRRHQRVLRYNSFQGSHDTISVPVATTLPASPLLQQSPSDGRAPIAPSQQASQLQVVPSLGGTKISASTLSPNFSPYKNDNRSSVSGGSSVSRMTGNPTDDLPHPPTLKGAERYFQCPYCCMQLPRKRSMRRAWAYVNDKPT